MSLPEAESRQLVCIEGVVTHQRRNGEAGFVQNEEGGVCCWSGSKPAFDVPPGHRVRVEGRTMTGGYAPAVRLEKITVLDKAAVPAPERLSLAQIVAGQRDGQFVEVHGVVRRAELHSTGQWTLDIVSEQHRVTATVEHGALSDPARWVDGVARLRGVAGVSVNRLGQLVAAALRVQSFDDVALESEPPIDPFAIPVKPIQSIMKFSMEPTAREHRVKVRGFVLHQSPDGMLYLQNDTGGLRAGCRMSETPHVGEEVEVLGFPVWGDYSPWLEDACFQRVSEGMPQSPAMVSAKDLIEGRLDARLVRLDARLVAQTHQPDEQVLMLESSNVLLPARLSAQTGLDNLRNGSLLRVTGVCRAHLKERHLPSGQQPAPVYDLVLRSAQDVTVIQAAPWWTLQRLLWLAAGMTLLLAATMSWGFLLRRRVRQQTAIIGERLQAQAAAEERARVARELHDTVEQDLAAVAMHLGVIETHGAPLTEVASENLEAAIKQVRRSQKDAHQAVWDLRSVTLSERGLAAALEEMLAQTVPAGAMSASFQMKGHAMSIPSVMEHHLLRIAQEAVTNAVHHGQPSSIKLTLTFEAARLTLRVEDDGTGFNPLEAAECSERFGLLGMRERAARIGAALATQSSPGQGTIVELSLPLLNPLSHP